MRISVVMAVYDGEKYILEQLDSIMNQTKIADEVIICDDCSKDNTVKMVREYIEVNRLNNWVLVTNEVNQGWKKNFYNGLNISNGDIIFFSDQDDVWELDKLEKMADLMTKDKRILALSGSLSLIDENGEKLPNSSLLPFYGENTGDVYINEFNSKIVYSIVPGCSLAIRKSLTEYVKGRDLTFIPHDAFFWKMATILEGAYYFDKDVIKYRVHDTNASGATTKNIIGKTNLIERISGLQESIKVVKAFIEILKTIEIEKKELKMSILSKSLSILNTRIAFLRDRRILCLPKLIANKKYYPSFSVLIGDTSYFININKFAGKIFWKVYKKNKT